jgi:NAD-dependent dihydropyrimidine dehydrogenase PreA subunit
MAKQELWHGIPRKDIPWYPTVGADTCIGCTLCFATCGRSVYDMLDNLAVVVNPMNCMVGCSTCATVCPVQAIHFPDRSLVWKLEREHKIFKIVRQESEEKKAKLDAARARAAAEDAIAKLTTRARIEIAGQLSEKRCLTQLDELVQDRPFDLVNLRLEIPTVQGMRTNTPSRMTFEITSTEQEDIGGYLSEVRDWIRRNGWVLISEQHL